MGVTRPRLIFDEKGRLVRIDPGRHSVRDSRLGPFALPLVVGLFILAVILNLSGCGPSKPRPEPVEVGDFVVYRLTGEKVMVAAVPYVPMFPEGTRHHEFYGVRFKDGREKWCKGPELQRLPKGSTR